MGPVNEKEMVSFGQILQGMIEDDNSLANI